VVVINWPVAHEPVDGCYNVRYPAPALAAYNAWLREETAARGLRYVDLHDLLPPERFLDSVHVTAAGQAEIADRLVEAVEPVVAEVAARRGRR
jgi:lysophospholipase L1-like esterase